MTVTALDLIATTIIVTMITMKLIATLIANAELQVLDRVGRNLVESTQLYGYGLLAVSVEQGRGKKMETTIACWGYIQIVYLLAVSREYRNVLPF